MHFEASDTLMTEKASVFWRMVFRQWDFTSFSVTIVTELFRFFFFHGHKATMILIMGKGSSGLWRGIPKKEKDAYANSNEGSIGK